MGLADKAFCRVYHFAGLQLDEYLYQQLRSYYYHLRAADKAGNLSSFNGLHEVNEKNVSELLAEIQTTQPNMSQHLHTLYQAGILDKRREGVQIHYRIIDERVANLCKVVCTQVAGDLDAPAS